MARNNTYDTDNPCDNWDIRMRQAEIYSFHLSIQLCFLLIRAHRHLYVAIIDPSLDARLPLFIFLPFLRTLQQRLPFSDFRLINPLFGIAECDVGEWRRLRIEVSGLRTHGSLRIDENNLIRTLLHK
ncbi:hypothetical protein BC936DRAFT_139496 [Jimgerdemannia flammicorona]|uniref:Uncharacterized protein n=1 Tax=Jimgerdemannia flammicorona TaxID=994334 RepID=A0A433B9T6_9FUNG|nr:hypothetical protein BC936DRAFT_139496 [Jimgerdemannia flammicorona]